MNGSGLLATNWHVVAGANHITVIFPAWNDAVKAELVVKDAVNDLAILRIVDTARLANTCPNLPFQLASANGVTLGEHVSAIGYPLTPMLGSNPKFTEGVISSKSGLQDDPRHLQISAQVQPGSSGSPLFDSEGNIVGVVVAVLDPGAVYQQAGAIPQNVNFAIKADYLLSLVAVVPGGLLGTRTTAFSPEKAAQCVAIIQASTIPTPQPTIANASRAETLGTIFVTSNPDGAELYIDNSFMVRTPATIELKPGQHGVRLFMTGYENWVQWVTLQAAGAKLNITATLTKSK